MSTELSASTTSSQLLEPGEQQPTSLFSKGGFELIQRMAQAFSQSTLVPKIYQGKTGLANCIIALNMAQRIGSDPLCTMQNLYVVHGNPGWSAQFLIATFNTCGRFSSIRYEWVGEEGKPDWGCRALAIELATGEELRGCLITMKLAHDEGWATKAGSKWKTMPEQMLRYRAAAWFVRAYAPEIAMGLHTVDELQDIPTQPVQVANPSKATAVSVESLLDGKSESKVEYEEPANGELFASEQTTAPEDG